MLFIDMNWIKRIAESQCHAISRGTAHGCAFWANESKQARVSIERMFLDQEDGLSLHGCWRMRAKTDLAGV